jgi:hypothetical protein
MEIANTLWHGTHKNKNFQQLLWINKTNFWHPRFQIETERIFFYCLNLNYNSQMLPTFKLTNEFYKLKKPFHPCVWCPNFSNFSFKVELDIEFEHVKVEHEKFKSLKCLQYVVVWCIWPIFCFFYSISVSCF